jgi:type II secretory pathway pseudopilin PulG
MLTVIVVSVLAALALDRVAELQAYAQEAEAATLAAQRRTSEALAQAREGLPHAAAASTPHHRPPAQAPLARAAP